MANAFYEIKESEECNMKYCSRHHNIEATEVCEECGQPLCDDCYNYFQGHMCLDCAKNLLKHDQKLFRKVMIWGILLAIVFAVALGIIMGSAGLDGGMTALICLYAATGGYAFGYTLVANRDTQKTWKDIAIWALLDLIIGPIMFIVDLVRMIKWGKEIKACKLSVEACKEDL